MISGGRYLSCDDTLRVFSAGKSTSGMRLEVTWRSGLVSVVPDVKPNRVYEISEADAKPAPKSPVQPDKPMFADASALIQHRHFEDPFEDFERQPLLSRRLSQLGPGVSWADVDGDGWEDLIIGTGSGGKLAVYRNNGKGGFELVDKTPLDKPMPRDTEIVQSLAQ